MYLSSQCRNHASNIHAISIWRRRLSSYRNSHFDMRRLIITIWMPIFGKTVNLGIGSCLVLHGTKQIPELIWLIIRRFCGIHRTAFSGKILIISISKMSLKITILKLLLHLLTHWARDTRGRHFADDIFKSIFLNESVWIPIKISLKFVPKGPNNNIPAMVQMMAWRRPGDKPLSEPMMVSLLTHICVARSQWVKGQCVEVWCTSTHFTLYIACKGYVVAKYRKCTLNNHFSS